MSGGITHDNTHLSELIQVTPGQSKFANNLKNWRHGCSDPKILQFITAAIAENTRRAYDSDLRHFTAWGGHLPGTPEQIARYLADHAASSWPRSPAGSPASAQRTSRGDFLTQPKVNSFALSCGSFTDRTCGAADGRHRPPADAGRRTASGKCIRLRRPHRHL
jgi:hypothetical protein